MRLLMFVVLAAVACGPTSGTTESPPSARDWAAPFLGESPRTVVVQRPYPRLLEIERHMSPAKFTKERTAAEQLILFAMNRCGQSESYGDVIVLHGVPPWIDPQRPLSAKGAPFVFAFQAPTNVRFYREPASDPADARLFVLPSSTWVIARGVPGRRLAYAFATAPSEPPVLDAVPGAFADSTYVVSTRREVLESFPWVLRPDRVTAIGLVTYPIVPAGEIPQGGKIVFSDERSAEDAAADARRVLARPDKDVRVDRFGTTIVVRQSSRGGG